MNLLLDTHFIIWITLDRSRLRQFRWLGKYQPWGVSPISMIEIQFLAEVGRLAVRQPDFFDAILSDRRFVVDDVPLLSLTRRSFELQWTRDPFDRLLVAHSLVRRVPFCSIDRIVREHHRLVPDELR